MSRLTISRVAETDLTDIVQAIRDHNPRAAVEWAARMQEKCENIAANPGIGQRRPDLPTGDYRISIAGKYVIVYRLANGDGVEIVRVLHGAREWEKLL